MADRISVNCCRRFQRAGRFCAPECAATGRISNRRTLCALTGDLPCRFGAGETAANDADAVLA